MRAQIDDVSNGDVPPAWARLKRDMFRTCLAQCRQKYFANGNRISSRVSPQLFEAIRRFGKDYPDGMICSIDTPDFLHPPKSHVRAEEIERGLIESQSPAPCAEQPPVSRRC